MHFLCIVGERESAGVAADFIAIFNAFFSRNDNSLKKPVQHRQHHLQKQKDKKLAVKIVSFHKERMQLTAKSPCPPTTISIVQ